MSQYKKSASLILFLLILMTAPGFADVSALGRLEPHNGVFNIMSPIIAEAVASRAELSQSRLTVRQKSLARAAIYSPIKGRVLDVLAWPGESIGARGILELGETGNMYAVAEVYETDIYKVKAGQSATVSSPALPNFIRDTVERVRPMVRKHDVTGTDPAARKDARVVEVEIKLAEATSVAELTNLQVEVVIDN